MFRYQFIRFPEGKSKAVTLSYDDGCPEDLSFSDIISPAGLKCTFNLNDGDGPFVPKYSTEDIEKYIYDRGHEVAVHGEFHRAPGLVRSADVIQDVLFCRRALEKRLGRIIRGMAYPDSGIRLMQTGNSYEEIRQYLKGLDIAYARALNRTNDDFTLPDDFLAWMPTCHQLDEELPQKIDRFLAIRPEENYWASRYPRLFYLWGHTYEFTRAGSFDLAKRFTEKLAGHADIWYATNIEIYDYVTAYYRLEYSLDGDRVYNPTLYTLYFERNGKPYHIASGETLTF